MTLLDKYCRTFPENFNTENFYKVKRYIKKYIKRNQHMNLDDIIICNSSKYISKYVNLQTLNQIYINLDKFDFEKSINNNIFCSYYTTIYYHALNYFNDYIKELEGKIRDKKYRKHNKRRFEFCGYTNCAKPFWKTAKSKRKYVSELYKFQTNGRKIKHLSDLEEDWYY